MSEAVENETPRNDENNQHRPHRLSFSNNVLGRTWDKVENWLKKDVDAKEPGFVKEPATLCDTEELEALKKNPSRKALPGLPRPQTFQRQNSERRDRLTPYEPDAEERRATSADRRCAPSNLRSVSPAIPLYPSQSAPDINPAELQTEPFPNLDTNDEQISKPKLSEANLVEAPLGRISSISVHSLEDENERVSIQAELDATWILNLSMRFKDRSDREKFFLTYAEKRNKWRRLTVSCDYRNASEDSLEADLKSMHYQRDKTARIYDSIRDSLPDIQFYPTVTNLKLKTIEGRLHIHCSEDVNEIIKYPHVTLLSHIPYPVYKDSDVVFEFHISGYVYSVSVGGASYVKKEIPGPDSVDEFIYEANALASLRDSKNVIDFHGLVIDDDEKVIKGLLINWASRGALVDIIYDSRFSTALPWSRRQNWARQIINGLTEIHEAGFVQGDFTLNNVVVHDDDSISIIDINRRGCPVGWEPPELEPMIRSGQRISMFISVKTDLFQLGMVLWGLAMCIDEPQREPRPLREINQPDVPQYYRDIVQICLDSDPRKRLSARSLLEQFPQFESPSISLQTVEGHVVNHTERLSEFPFADAGTSSDYCFDSRDSGIVQDEARDSSPLIKFEDEDMVQTDFKPFAPSEEIDNLASRMAEVHVGVTRDESIIDPTPDSEVGTLTPRPASFQINRNSLVGILHDEVPASRTSEPPLTDTLPIPSTTESLETTITISDSKIPETETG